MRKIADLMWTMILLRTSDSVYCLITLMIFYPKTESFCNPMSKLSQDCLTLFQLRLVQVGTVHRDNNHRLLLLKNRQNQIHQIAQVSVICR